MKVARRFGRRSRRVPATAVEVVWSVRLKVVVVRVAWSIASEKVAVGAVPVGWFVAPLAGVKPVTVGGVVSVVPLPQVSLALAQSPWP